MNLKHSRFIKISYTTIFSYILVFLILVPPLPVSAAKTDYERLKSDSIHATQLLEPLFEESWKTTEETVKERARTKGYDIDLTMESFRQQGNPFKSYDIEGLLAAYATIKGKNHLEIGLQDIPFVSSKLEETKITEYTPLKVCQYQLQENGLYAKDGYTYINYPSNRDVFTPLENGFYQKSGTIVYTPKTIKTVYAEVTLSVLTPKQLFSYFKVPYTAEVENEYERRKQNIIFALQSENLKQSMFLMTADNLLLSTEQRTYLETTSKTLSGYQKAIFDTAISLIGKVPYEWGGKSERSGYDTSWYTFTKNGTQKGLDCSGYVQWVYQTAGYDQTVSSKLLSTSSMLQNLTPICYEELEIGDIGLLNSGTSTNHCGIYLGSHKWIHCSSQYNTVAISDNYPFTVFMKIENLSEINSKIDISNKLVYYTYISNVD